MLMQPVLGQLGELRLVGMCSGLEQQLASAQYAELSFEEQLGLLVDQGWTQRQDTRFRRQVTAARLAQSVPIEAAAHMPESHRSIAAWAPERRVSQMLSPVMRGRLAAPPTYSSNLRAAVNRGRLSGFDIQGSPFGYRLEPARSRGRAVDTVDSQERCPQYPQRLRRRRPDLPNHAFEIVIQKATPFRITQRERFLVWAAKTGRETRALVEALLAGRRYPRQAFRSCLGVLSLERRYGAERLEAACRRARHFGLASYRGVKNILERGLDGAPIEAPLETSTEAHVRGASYYA